MRECGFLRVGFRSGVLLPSIVVSFLLCCWVSPIHLAVLDCVLSQGEADSFTFPGICSDSKLYSGNFTIPPTACSSQSFSVCEVQFIYSSGPGFICDTSQTSSFSMWGCDIPDPLDSLMVYLYQSGLMLMPNVINSISVTNFFTSLCPPTAPDYAKFITGIGLNPTVNMTYATPINVSPGETLILAYWEQYYNCFVSDNVGSECITVVLRPCNVSYLSSSPSTTAAISLSPQPSLSTLSSETESASPTISLHSSLSPTPTTTTVSSTKPPLTSPKPSKSAPSDLSLQEELAQNPTKAVTKQEVTSTEYQFSDAAAKSDVSVIIKSGNDITGSVSIPANTFPPGCVLRIRSSSKQVSSPRVNDGSECSGAQETESTRLSSQFSLTLSGPCKNQTKFDNFLDIQLVVDHNDADQGCLAYSPSESSEWTCLETLVDNFNHSGYSIVSGKVDHFTSFAVLLLPECPTEDWIWIASLSLVAGALTISSVVIAAFFLSRSFRGFVGGFRASRLSSVMKRLDKASATSTNSLPTR